MLFASNVDVVARAFVTHMIHLKSHSWCIYIPTFPIQLIHLRGQKIYRFVPWIPMRFRQSTPSSWRALWSPQIVVKSEGMNPPKMPRTPKTEGGSNYQVHSSRRDLFVIPKIVGEVTELITIPTKNRSPAELPFAFEFFENPLGLSVKWHESVNRKFRGKKRVQEKKSCTSWEVVISPIVGVSMGVSENGGTPKSSILIGFSIKKTIHFGVPLFLETSICPFAENFLFSRVGWPNPNCWEGLDPGTKMATLPSNLQGFLTCCWWTKSCTTWDG